MGTTSNRGYHSNLDPNVRDSIEIVETDLLNQNSIEQMLYHYRPSEVYNLAARASSTDLWTDPVLTGEVNGLTVGRLLASIYKVNRDIRFAQASSSEIFGNATEVPQTENTPLKPRNPYGIAKAYAHWTTSLYRQYQSLFACSAIFYNHESPRRGLEFVTRKITHAAARISLGDRSEVRLGRLDARRDWGFAGDYVQALWLMLQQPQPDDYIVATGETHTVLEFCQLAFAYVGLNYLEFVAQDLDSTRPPELGQLVGNPIKSNRVLGWNPSVTFPGLVSMMVDADLKRLQRSRERSIPAL